MSDRPSVLIVDDESAILDTLRILLKNDGFDVRVAQGGKAGLEAIASHSPQVVLSDIRMPRVDGIQLERTCRERWPGIPVLLMSGEVTRDWVLRLVREGAPEVIRKPFQPATLVQTVRSILQPPNGGAHNLAGG